MLPKHQKFVHFNRRDHDLTWTCEGCKEEIPESEEPAHYGNFTGQPYCKACVDCPETLAIAEEVAR